MSSTLTFSIPFCFAWYQNENLPEGSTSHRYQAGAAASSEDSEELPRHPQLQSTEHDAPGRCGRAPLPVPR